jgi:hypothetical protein
VEARSLGAHVLLEKDTDAITGGERFRRIADVRRVRSERASPRATAQIQRYGLRCAA